jgi:hypothetical protein
VNLCSLSKGSWVRYNLIVKTCTACNTGFEVTDADRAFYKTMDLPDPKMCPPCRQQRRLIARNLRSLYWRKCDLSGRKMLSMYHEDCEHPIYHSDVWWSDKWDPMEYGRDFDFSRPFFKQFATFYKKIPLIHSSVLLTENCDYINGAANCKDCYLSFNMDYCEHCYYTGDSTRTLHCLDSYGMLKCELCYQCLDCENGYSLQYCQRCVSCKDSYFLSDCRQVKNSIACCNLVGKEYHIFNEQVSPKEFEAFKESLKDRSKLEEVKKQFHEFQLKFPKKYYTGHSNEGFSGDRVQHVKDSTVCFDTYELENCHYCYYIFQANNCMDYDIFGDHSEWIYNSVATGINCSNDICCIFAWDGVSNCAYSILMSGSKDCFGCSGLRQKQYCIFNKQYSKEDYFKLREKIVEHMKKTGEWGQFFPPSISPFAYNETMANEFHPLSKEEALEKGFGWRDKEEAAIKADKTIPAERLPSTIADVPDDVTQWAIECKESGKPFKIIPQELKFYRQQGIPLPQFHPDVRYTHRLKLRNPRRLYDRKCDKCQADIQTSYRPDQPETVYCEPCYLAEVY